jgi:hypothetical protein
MNMARPKKFGNAAARQRAYRQRKSWEKLPPAEQLARRADASHDALSWHAEQGDPVAAQILGEDYTETALKLLVHLGPLALPAARHQALERMNRARNLDVN